MGSCVDPSPPPSSSAKSRRVVCARCTKPERLCLCARIKPPLPLDNPIPLTILQHPLEASHPLNSTRVARLGLNKIDVVSVSEVNFHAHFIIRPLDSREETGIGVGFQKPGSDRNSNLINGCEETERVGVGDEGFDRVNYKKRGSLETLILDKGSWNGGPDEKFSLVTTNYDANLDKKNVIGFEDNECDGDFETINTQTLFSGSSVQESLNGHEKPECGLQESFSDPVNVEGMLDELDASQEAIVNVAVLSELMDSDGDYEFQETLPKFKVKCSSSRIFLRIERGVQPDMRGAAATSVGRTVARDGFLVKKVHRERIGLTDKFKDFVEFGIAVPPGSVLLYPSDKSIDMKTVDFKVRHLIVLDGTWSKAKRIYHENPWLELLPHVKLDVKKESLYSDVRHEPKTGYLSTIESIVCAMRALGGNINGFDELLDVFESMIVDQRRCKDEKFARIAISRV